MLKNDKLCNCYHMYAFVLSLILACALPVYADSADDSISDSSGSDSVYNDYYTDVSVSPIIQTLPEVSFWKSSLLLIGFQLLTLLGLKVSCSLLLVIMILLLLIIHISQAMVILHILYRLNVIGLG